MCLSQSRSRHHRFTLWRDSKAECRETHVLASPLSSSFGKLSVTHILSTLTKNALFKFMQLLDFEDLWSLNCKPLTFTNI